MVIREAINKVKNYITISDNPMFEAKQIVAFAMGIDQNDIILNPKMQVDFDKIMELVKRRQNGEPLWYILKSAEFMSLEFEVNEDVLIPRSDTETLVELLIEEIGDRPLTVLDIGSGSGCIGTSIGHYCKNTSISFLDVSKAALAVAQENAKRHKLNASFYNMDILKEYPNTKFDVVVSNPPYIRTDVIKTLQTEVKDHEPLLALDGGADGLLFYRRIVNIAPMLLNKNGILAFEIGYDQGYDVYELMKIRFSECEIVKDLTHNDRVVWGKNKTE